MASIVQNLPTTGAKSARAAGRSVANSSDFSDRAASFDQVLKRSAERAPTRDESIAGSGRADSAEKPSSDQAAKPRKVDRKSKTATTENEPQAEAPAEGVESNEPAGEAPVEEVGATDEQPVESPVEAETTLAPQKADAAAALAVATTGQPVIAAAPVAAVAGTESTEEVEATETAPAVTATVVATGPKPAEAKSSASTSSQILVNGDEEPTAENGQIALPDDFVDDTLDAIAPVVDPDSTAPAIAKTTPEKPVSADSASEAKLPSAEDSLTAPPIAQAPVAAAAPSTDASLLNPAPVQSHTTAPSVAPTQNATPIAAPVPFAEANHEQIVSTVRGHLLPNGGTMQIRLDPPELGALMVQVTLRDGLIDAAFQTNNAEATQLLSHSLTQLKHSLEAQGVSVDKLSVAQAPRNEKSDQQNDKNNSQQQGQTQMDWQRHSDQQRKEMLRKMWAKLGVGDPLDMVA